MFVVSWSPCGFRCPSRRFRCWCLVRLAISISVVSFPEGDIAIQLHHQCAEQKKTENKIRSGGGEMLLNNNTTVNCTRQIPPMNSFSLWYKINPTKDSTTNNREKRIVRNIEKVGDWLFSWMGISCSSTRTTYSQQSWDSRDGSRPILDSFRCKSFVWSQIGWTPQKLNTSRAIK